MKWNNLKEVVEVLDKDKTIYDIFCECPYEILKTVRLKKYRSGEFRLENGEVYDKFFVIVEGEADIFFVSDNGKKYHISTYKKGQFLGELEHFDRNPFLSLVEVRGEVVTLEMGREEYLTWLEKDNNFKQYVLRALCRYTYSSMQKMSEATLYTLKQRVCQYFIENTNEKGKSSMLLNVEELSERMGVTTRSVNRILKELKDKNILEINNSKVMITNREQLLKEKNEK